MQKLLCQFASGSLHPCLCDSVILLATGEILLSDSLTGTCTHRLGRHPLSQWPRPKVCLDNPWHPEGLSGWELLNFQLVLNSWAKFYYFVIYLKNLWDFPGGPVVKSPHSQCRGPGFNPLARKLEPACLSKEASLHATIKTQGSQIKKKKSANEIISFLI